MTDKLSLYNDALLLVGERFLASLTEEREPRRLLDQVWNSGGVKYCLEQGQWFFAMRTILIDYDPSIQPSYGYERAFLKPTDWVNTSSISSDEFFRTPLTQYVDEAGFWYASLDSLYVRYVSNDVNYGMNYSLWPDSFREFVAAHLASRIVIKLSNSEAERNNIHALRKELLKNAKSRCAMAESTKFPAQGNWTKSRMRGGGRRGDGGNNNTSGNLIG